VDEQTMRKALTAIAWLTVGTGGAQAVAPGPMLQPLAAENDEATRHLFRTVGMFMVVVGGGLAQTLHGGPGEPSVVFWTGMQKLGASGAVGLGVKRGVFSPLALTVASFDFLSGAVALGYWRRLRRR
jgi:hypothetical protein